MQKGLQIGLLAVVAVLLGVVAYGLMDKDQTDEATHRTKDGATPVVSATNKNPKADPNLPETGELTPTGDIQQNSKPGSDDQVDPNLPTTTVDFDSFEHDFGVIDEGDKVEHIFKFTNTGTNPLILSNCKGSCGCTVPTCPKDPIPPGGDGEIKVVFNSRNKKNKQTKRVTITANTAPKTQTILTISADVTPAPEEGE